MDGQFEKAAEISKIGENSINQAFQSFKRAISNGPDYTYVGYNDPESYGWGLPPFTWGLYFNGGLANLAIAINLYEDGMLEESKEYFYAGNNISSTAIPRAEFLGILNTPMYAYSAINHYFADKLDLGLGGTAGEARDRATRAKNYGLSDVEKDMGTGPLTMFWDYFNEIPIWYPPIPIIKEFSVKSSGILGDELIIKCVAENMNGNPENVNENYLKGIKIFIEVEQPIGPQARVADYIDPDDSGEGCGFTKTLTKEIKWKKMSLGWVEYYPDGTMGLYHSNPDNDFEVTISDEYWNYLYGDKYDFVNNMTHNFDIPHLIPKPVNSPTVAKVKRVIDGDTIELENGERVRYLNIDTPETNHPTIQKECYGDEATKLNKDLVEGKNVILISSSLDKDIYGRLLRYVFLGNDIENIGLFVQGELLRKGAAINKSYGNEYYYATAFIYSGVRIHDYKEEAMANKIGIWGECNWNDTIGGTERGRNYVNP
tara:strand:- start:4 stop:1461 length:1458 start_codon:yes stop_codon:yes gene_type:complete